MIGDKKVTPAIVINGGGTPIHNQTIEERIESNGYYEYTPDAGYTGLDRVALSVDIFPEINNQDKTVTENGVYTPDEGYTGLGTVTVNVEGGGTGTIYGMDPKAFLGYTTSDGMIVRNEEPISVNFGDATYVGDMVYQDVFRNKEITSFVGNSITNVGTSAFQDAFKSSIVRSLSLPNLQTVGDRAFYQAFHATHVYNLDMFSNIQTVGYMAFGEAFYSTTIDGITDIRFDNLTLVNQYGFTNAFASAIPGSDGLDVWFPKLQEVRDYGFANIADDNTQGIIRLHFPAELQSVIEQQSGYPWPHTEVLFDADGYPCTFGLVYPTLYTLPLVIFNDKDITDTKVGYITKSGTNRLIAILQKNATGKRWVISPKMTYREDTESYTYNINGMQDTGDRYEGSAHIVCTNVTNATFTLFVDGHEIMSETGAECTFYANTYNLFPGRYPFDAKVVVTAEGYAPDEFDIAFSAAGTASTEYSATLREPYNRVPYNESYPFDGGVSDGRFMNLLGDNKFVKDDDRSTIKSTNQKLGNTVCTGYMYFDRLDTDLATTVRVNCMVSSEQNYDYGAIVVADRPLTYLTHEDVCTGAWHDATVYSVVLHESGVEGEFTVREGIVNAGVNSFYVTFMYAKDSSAEAGDDCLYVNAVEVYQGE